MIASKSQQKGKSSASKRNPASTLLRKLVGNVCTLRRDQLGRFLRSPDRALLAEHRRHGHFTSGRLSSLDLERHYEEVDTLYGWADGRIRTPLTIACIDIDNHDGIGTIEGALAFARYLADELFPGLYFEPSTNKAGVHGYLLIDKRGFGDHRLRSLFDFLAPVLRAYLRR
jgi:hypothetical protein